MSKLTPEITAKLAVLEKQIKTDLREFNSDFKAARERAENAAVSGWQIGKALLEAKGLIAHGNFTAWIEKFGIAERTGQLFMQKARDYPELKDFIANRREAILSTGLLPDKPEVHHEGNVQFPLSGNHASWLTKALQWTNNVKAGTVHIEPEQAKNDLRPIYDWLKELYGE